MDEFVVDGAATAAGWYYGRGRTSSSSSSSRGAVIFIGEDDPTRIDVVGVVIVRQCHRRRRHHHSEDIDGYSNFTMKGAETRGRYWYIGIGCNNETNSIDLFNKNNYCRQCRVKYQDGVKVVKTKGTRDDDIIMTTAGGRSFCHRHRRSSTVRSE